MAEDNATKTSNGVFIVDGAGNHNKEPRHELTLYTILNRLIAAIFFPGPNSSVPLSQRIKTSLSDNVPLLRDASRNTAHHVLLWTRRGTPLRALLVVSVSRFRCFFTRRSLLYEEIDKEWNFIEKNKHHLV